MLFIVTIFEGLPIIGQFIPGHTIVLISGFLAKVGVLKLSIVIPVVVISAIIGDAAGYFLGRKYGLSLLEKFGAIFFLKREYIEKATKLVAEHPAKTIILGRFSPITRPLSPFIVGASGAHSKIFWLYDFVAVLLWALPSIAIGYIFGASYHVVAAMFGKFIFVAIVLGILMIWGYRFINKNFHIFARYEIITLTVNLLGLYLFFKTVQDAITDKVSLLELDLFVNNYFLSHSKQFWIVFMNIVTNILSPESIAVAGATLILYFIYKRKYYNTAVTAISLGGGYVFTYILKNIVERIRPESGFIVETGFSFPSGHAVLATVFAVLIVYIFAIRIKSILWREISIVVCVLLPLLTCFSRVYLGVHWLSDVLAGIGFGLFYTTLVLLTVKYIRMVVVIFVRKIKL